MSRTDKDRPWWVARVQDGKIIEHDHRKGECIEETVETARAFANGGFGRRGYHKHGKCKKNVVIEFSCRPQKVDGRRTLVYDIDLGDRVWVRNFSKKGCWSWTCDHEHDPWSLERYYCDEKYFVKCGGHWTRRYDASIPCVCDTWPANPTCEIAEETGHRYRWYSGGVPSEFVRGVYHRPERARERGLDDALRMFNAGEDIEDFDFENRQARNSARWLWW